MWNEKMLSVKGYSDLLPLKSWLVRPTTILYEMCIFFLTKLFLK